MNDRKEPLWRGWNRYRVPGGGGLEGKGEREGGLEGESLSNYL